MADHEPRYPSIIEQVTPNTRPMCDYEPPTPDGSGEPCGRPAKGFVALKLNGVEFTVYTCNLHRGRAVRGPGTIVALGIIEVVCDACARTRGRTGRPCTH